MSVAAAAIGAASSLLGNFFGSYHNEQMVEQTNANNRELIERQNQMNIEQWQRENAYNHPVNQMLRLRAAGINPGIMYGSGGVMNSSAPSPAMQSSRDVPPQSTFQIDPLTVAQIENIDAQTRKLNAEADSEEQMRQSRIENLNASTANLFEQNKKIVQEIENLKKSGKLTEKQIEQFKFDNAMRGKQYALDRKRLQNETKMTNKQIAALDAEIQKTLAEKRITDREYNEMVWTFAIRKSGLEAQVNLTNAQIEQANATARKLGFDADMIEAAAGSEKYYAESLRGQHGYGNFIIASVRSGIQMVLRDFGSALGGIFK